MNRDDIKIGMKVVFGREGINDGKMTEGVVVKINKKTVMIKTTEERSYGRGNNKRVIPSGEVWRTSFNIIEVKQ